MARREPATNDRTIDRATHSFKRISQSDAMVYASGSRSDAGIARSSATAVARLRQSKCLALAPTRTYHVENYKLLLRFDELKGEVFGNEVITLKPFGQHFHEFYLNSSELTIDSVSLERGHETPVRLAYTTEDPRFSIKLDRDYDTTSVLLIHVAYHGFPRTGLFFVNPDSNYPQGPREVYSQGETEFNRFWLPCWDYPNDMATSETITTVPEGQVVVSNGRLISTTHSAGNVTYDWVEAVPHSSYLISIAAGPWRKVTDRYENKPVDYYTPRYVDEATARRSFHLTPDMIGFFSRASGVNYPYEQYAQTTVHDYMFGGQENVSTDDVPYPHVIESGSPHARYAVIDRVGNHWRAQFVCVEYDWAVAAAIAAKSGSAWAHAIATGYA